MGWERGRYYTRSRKKNGRVVREYVGMGPIAQIAAQMDALKREKRKVEAAQAEEARGQAERADEDLLAVERLADALARAALVAAGCHQHNRGEWRRKRERP